MLHLGFDEARMMTGCFSGTQEFIHSEYLVAPYVCATHYLNVVINTPSEIPALGNSLVIIATTTFINKST